MQRYIRLTVVGKVFRPNRVKVFALNQCLAEYYRLVKYYLKLNLVSKNELHGFYDGIKTMFYLPTALIQTARDKAVETLTSFEENAREESKLRLRHISIRFDQRCYGLSKTTNILTPYWINLKLNREKRLSFPVMFGEKQKTLIEEAFEGEWKFTTLEMVKRDGEWYAHFVLKRTVSFTQPQTVIGLDIGEVNLATAIAFTNKPSRGRFWRGSEIKSTRGLYNHIRRGLGMRGLTAKIKSIGRREKNRVNERLHILSRQLVEYTTQFPRPIIAMEDLSGLRRRMNFSRKSNRRVHSMPYCKLQNYIQYKAGLKGIEVRYVSARNTSRTCHRCGHVARQVVGRRFTCDKCGLLYNRDLNAATNIAHALMRRMGWGSVTPPNSQMRTTVENPV